MGALIGRVKTALSDITDELGFGARGYAYIIEDDGNLHAYPNRYWCCRGEHFDDTGSTNAGRAIRPLASARTV